MSTRWIEPVRSSGTLKVHAKSTMVGDWARVLQEAMTELNALSSSGNFGVSLVSERDEAQANVVASTVDGTVSTDFDGTTYQTNLAGNAPQGHTRLYQRGGRVEKAHVFLPVTPGAFPRIRGYGRPVRLVIAFHELIHCCGLHNSDHGHLAFVARPSATRGSTAAEDRLTVMHNGEYVHMPPLVITDATGRLIRDNWADP